MFIWFFLASCQTPNKAQVSKGNYNIEIKEVLPFEYLQLIKRESVNFKNKPDTLSVNTFLEKFNFQFSKNKDSFLIFPPENICFWSKKANSLDTLCFESSWGSSFLKHSNFGLGNSNPNYVSGGYVLHYKNERFINYYFTICLEIRSEIEDPYSVLLIEYCYILTEVI